MLDQLSKVWGESYIGIFRYFDGWPKMGKTGVILAPRRHCGAMQRRSSSTDEDAPDNDKKEVRHHHLSLTTHLNLNNPEPTRGKACFETDN